MKRTLITATIGSLLTCLSAVAADKKPNILVIWGDDVGQSNISAYTRGMMGYQTPNIDCIAKEGILFTDYYGDLTALRYDDWKAVFMEQKTVGTFRVWMEPFVPLRLPLIFNLRRDSYERAEITSNTYYDWMLDRVYLLMPAQTYVGKFLKTFKEHPPRQKAATFSLDQVMEKLAPPTK